ncbi:MAG: hypothetical protein ABSC55_09470 [Syntrophorhabdales bacterium]|jgi:hypothetical protein
MPKTFNPDEIREAMLKAHRESYELWWRLLNSTRDKEQVKSLYRYREGFDHALINLARKLGVDLSSSGTKGTQQKAKTAEEEPAIPDGQPPVCSQCNELLFKVSKKVWNCPHCKMNYLLGEE